MVARRILLRGPSRESRDRVSSAFVGADCLLECDEDKMRFEKRLGKIAKAKPAQKSK